MMQPMESLNNGSDLHQGPNSVPTACDPIMRVSEDACNQDDVSVEEAMYFTDRLFGSIFDSDDGFNDGTAPEEAAKDRSPGRSQSPHRVSPGEALTGDNWRVDPSTKETTRRRRLENSGNTEGQSPQTTEFRDGDTSGRKLVVKKKHTKKKNIKEKAGLGTTASTCALELISLAEQNIMDAALASETSHEDTIGFATPVATGLNAEKHSSREDDGEAAIRAVQKEMQSLVDRVKKHNSQQLCMQSDLERVAKSQRELQRRRQRNIQRALERAKALELAQRNMQNALERIARSEQDVRGNLVLVHQARYAPMAFQDVVDADSIAQAAYHDVEPIGSIESAPVSLKCRERMGRLEPLLAHRSAKNAVPVRLPPLLEGPQFSHRSETDGTRVGKPHPPLEAPPKHQPPRPVWIGQPRRPAPPTPAAGWIAGCIVPPVQLSEELAPKVYGAPICPGILAPAKLSGRRSRPRSLPKSSGPSRMEVPNSLLAANEADVVP